METLVDHPSSAAVRLWHPPRTARFAVAGLFFMNGVLFASWVSRIPAVQAALGLNHQALGLVLLGVALGALVAMPLAGWYVSRVGSHRVTQFTAVAYLATLPWLALAPSAGWLAVALFVFGGAHGAFDVAMNAQAVAVEARYPRPIMSSFHALWSFGCLIGALAGGLLATAGMPPFAHFVIAVLLLGTTTVAYTLPRLLDAGEAQAHALLHSVEGPRPKFTRPSSALVALGAIAFCIMMGEGAMADWSAVYLRDATGAGEGLAAAGYAAFSIAMAAVRFLGDPLAARFGPLALVRGGSALAAAGLAFALMVRDPLAALAGFAAVGAGFATIVPQVFSAVGRLPGIVPGPALAMATTIGYTGFLIGPPLIGVAAEYLGLRTALGFIVAMSLLAIALAPSVGRGRKAMRGA